MGAGKVWKKWLPLCALPIVVWYSYRELFLDSTDGIYSHFSCPSQRHDAGRAPGITCMIGEIAETVRPSSAEFGYEVRQFSNDSPHSRDGRAHGSGASQLRDVRDSATASVGAFRDPDDPASLPAPPEKLEIGLFKDPEDPKSVTIGSEKLEIGEFKDPDEQ